MDDARKNKFFGSINLNCRDVVIINAFLLLCLAMYILLYLLAYKMGCDNFIADYRDILIYVLWAVVVSIVFKYRLKDYTSIGITSGNILSNIIYVLAIILLYLSIKSSVALIFKLPLVSIIEKVQLEYSSKPLAVFLFHAGISLTIAPVIEEVIFRGFFYPPIRKKFGVFWGIIVSALIFSVWHVGASLRGIVNLFIIGIIFAYLYERSSSLIPSIIAHIVFNSNYLIFIVVYIVNKQGLVKFPPSQAYAIIVVTYLVLSTTLYIFYRKRVGTGRC